VDDLHAAADYLFMDDKLATSPDAVRRAFLSPFNELVDRLNELMLDKIQDRERSMFDFSLDPRLLSRCSHFDHNFTGMVILKANRTAETYHSHIFIPSRHWMTPASISPCEPRPTFSQQCMNQVCHQ
jgi:hypothetical protein